MTEPMDFGWMSLAPATQDAITAAATCPCRAHPCECEPSAGSGAPEVDTAAMRADHVGEYMEPDDVRADVRALCDALDAARARIAAAQAVIAGYDDIRDTCQTKAAGRQCLLCDIRGALGGGQARPT